MSPAVSPGGEAGAEPGGQRRPAGAVPRLAGVPAEPDLAEDLAWSVLLAVIFLVVLLLQRHAVVRGTHISLAFAVLPGILGLMVALGGLQGAAGSLAFEREDGALLRAKAVPHGIIGYLAGRIVSVSLGTLLGLVIILVPALFLVPELTRTSPFGWLTFAWVLVVGLLATLPWGAIIGSLAGGPRPSWAW